MYFNVSVFDNFAISHTLKLIFGPDFDKIWMRKPLKGMMIWIGTLEKTT